MVPTVLESNVHKIMCRLAVVDKSVPKILTACNFDFANKGNENTDSSQCGNSGVEKQKSTFFPFLSFILLWC